MNCSVGILHTAEPGQVTSTSMSRSRQGRLRIRAVFCQIIATLVAHQPPKHASVVRNVDARGRRVDLSLQNVRGKTLATAYSARASAFAGVSAPLTWEELEEGAAPQDFTMRTIPGRIQAVGDLWAALRESTRANLATVLE
jgi:bifunctional non-homologous end joining protein LigD